MSTLALDWYLAGLEAGRLPTSAEIVDLASQAKQRLHEVRTPAPSHVDPLIDGQLPASELGVQQIRVTETFRPDEVVEFAFERAALTVGVRHDRTLVRIELLVKPFGAA